MFVEAHPHAQTCTLTSFAGVLHGVKDVDNVRATCTDNPWEVGGILTGIKPGLSAVLLLKLTSGIYSLAIDAIGSFTFAIPVCEGSRYKVEFKDPMKQMAFLRKHGIKLWIQNADGIVQQPERIRRQRLNGRRKIQHKMSFTVRVVSRALAMCACYLQSGYVFNAIFV